MTTGNLSMAGGAVGQINEMQTNFLQTIKSNVERMSTLVSDLNDNSKIEAGRLELEHTEAIKRAVEFGLGIGCISRLALHEAFRRGSLVPITTPYLDLRRQFQFVWHKQKYQTAGMREFLALCRTLTAGVTRSDEIQLPFIV